MKTKKEYAKELIHEFLVQFKEQFYKPSVSSETEIKYCCTARELRKFSNEFLKNNGIDPKGVFAGPGEIVGGTGGQVEFWQGKGFIRR